MKKLITTALGLSFCFAANAYAAPMTLGSVSFDTDNAATTVLWAQGGVFAGLNENRREACIDPTNAASTVGANGIECRALEVVGFDLDTDVELDENNTVLQDPDVLAAFFDDGKVLINGVGNDVIVFETLDQDDPPAVTLILNGMQIIGDKLDVVEVDGKDYTIWGFDFTNLGFALDAVISAPLYVQTSRDDENTPIGSSDVAAIVGLNFQEPMEPTPEVPLPAAAWLFIAGISGLGFAGRAKKKTI
ncbi:VPLPA-CTERM sorting domain-containing protein [Hyphococcus sp.]|uniref:VPLPA-CTERM sorting domain-containing protein n=1 Tax=Hyphococcus sp. TaxID=2038636 RepID=UPI00208C15B6|nr:MAG: hypothetical protein DHS20C04_29520 [Marinicaulis sp.]